MLFRSLLLTSTVMLAWLDIESIHYHLDVDHETMPTVGFSSHVVKRSKKDVCTFYDLGGGARIRGIWPRYYASLHCAIFVVDASDRSRLQEARLSLNDCLNDPLFRGKALLMYVVSLSHCSLLSTRINLIYPILYLIDLQTNKMLRIA